MHRNIWHPEMPSKYIQFQHVNIAKPNREGTHMGRDVETCALNRQCRLYFKQSERGMTKNTTFPFPTPPPPTARPWLNDHIPKYLTLMAGLGINSKCLYSCKVFVVSKEPTRGLSVVLAGSKSMAVWQEHCGSWAGGRGLCSEPDLEVRTYGSHLNAGGSLDHLQGSKERPGLTRRKYALHANGSRCDP